jgi:histone-lysine N-methyltransferase SETMAR
MTWVAAKRHHIAAQYRQATQPTARIKLLQCYNWEVLDYPPYSPGLAPSDFHLFGPLKKHQGGFATDGKVQQAIMSWLQALDTDFFHAGTDALVYQWDKCLCNYGDYVEK